MTFTIDRNKFKTEIGKQCFDKIMELNPPNMDFVGLMLGLAKGDARRKILLKFLEDCKNWGELADFVIGNWGYKNSNN